MRGSFDSNGSLIGRTWHRRVKKVTKEYGDPGIKSLSVLGFEPRFLRPQRRVLTTIRHGHLISPARTLTFNLDIVTYTTSMKGGHVCGGQVWAGEGARETD